ncbi:MAG: hypothetical protein HY446_01500 [Candidatus Niyogibacteria bacterium]|nr:hypothetical protein [Candidatus Niyogibacteria bacterium]
MALAVIVFFGGERLKRPAADLISRKMKAFGGLAAGPVSFDFFFTSGEKYNLEKENRELRERVMELEAAESVAGFMASSEERISGAIPALILFRPPSISYDQFVVAKGEKDGVALGSLVLVGPNIFLGKVAEVFSETSRIEAFSSHGLELNVFLEKTNISVAAVGRSNHEFEITLPRDFPVEVGEKVFSLTDPPYLVGEVETVLAPASAPTKKLIVRQPFNIYTLRSLNILK